MGKESEFLNVGIFYTSGEARVAQALLASAKIPSFIRNENMTLIYPAISGETYPLQLAVRSEDYDLAVKILESNVDEEEFELEQQAEQ